MMVIALPVIISVLGAGAALRVVRQKKGVMTPERRRIYSAALAGSLKDPEKLRDLARAFRKEGLAPQARLLEQRAALKEASPELKKSRRDAFKRALKSQNKGAILDLAQAFQGIGATGCAAKLRAYASGLPDKVSASTNSPAPPAEPEPETEKIEESETVEESEEPEAEETEGSDDESSTSDDAEENHESGP